MKTLLLGVCCLFGAMGSLVLAEGSDSVRPQPAPPAQGIRVLELSGSPYERGVQHGRLLRAEIAQILALWKKDQGDFTQTDPELVVREFIAWSRHEKAIREWAPTLLDEVRGLADGAGQPFELMLAYQLLDEIWAFEDIPAKAHCSSIGVAKAGGHPAYVCQTMDLEVFRAGYEIVLHIQETEQEPEQYILSSAGMIGHSGINNRSIAVACNTVMPLESAPEGLPTAFVMRRLLAHSDGRAALNFIRRVPHATGQNFILGIGDRAFAFEVSSRGIVEHRSVPDGSVVWHTNHVLSSPYIKAWHKAKKPEELAADKEEQSSRARLASLGARLARPVSEIDAAVLRAALSAKDNPKLPICRHIREGELVFTMSAQIMGLSDAPYIELTKGPPDTNPFVRLDFKRRAQPATVDEPRAGKAQAP